MSEEPQSAAFLGKKVEVFPYQNGFRAAVPVPLATKAGSYAFTADFADGTHFEKAITVRSGKGRIIVLPPPPKLGLTGKQVVQNLDSVNQTVRKSVEEVADITRFNATFGLPLYDNRKISSPFGEVRQTGSERITHLGVDFDNPKGRMVAAINSGVVKSAYLDAIYGNTVILDHGRGIYSLYMHLDTMKVKAGDAVKKGTIVGTVGESGLASAPHLHLSIKIKGVSVDPIQFVSVFR
ncbi:MAG TPA: M23 family metallopeptidase [Candidatus Paceibacterota bacterium]|nr:M23 family metallopeptidase [Candidatus Paceibacterota bacterium]